MPASDILLRIPLKPAFYGSLAAGLAAGAGLQHALADDGGSQSLTGFATGLWGGWGLMGGALAVGLRLERQPGPFASAWAVDGAEQVRRTTISLNFGPKAGKAGAILVGAGFGVGLAALQALGAPRTEANDG